MSINFSANQLLRECNTLHPESTTLGPVRQLQTNPQFASYESGFVPRRLSNWEAGARLGRRPDQRTGVTKIIADDRGHLLPGIARTGNPWGDYKGTWQLPKKITKKLASALGWRRGSNKKLTSWEKRSKHAPVHTPSPPPIVNESKEKKKKSKKKESSVELPNENLKKNEFQPFEKDEHDYTNTMACDDLPKVLDVPQQVEKDFQSFNENVRGEFQRKEPLEELLDRSKEARDGMVEDAPSRGSTPKSQGSHRSHGSAGSKGSRKSRKLSQVETPPPIDQFLGAQYAKNLHMENLKHQPLPDTVEHEGFKALQMQRDKHPGRAIDIETETTAIGTKAYESPGPTQCSKMKIYRPKTGVHKKRDKSEDKPRPKTCVITNREVSEIDLALCWDLMAPSIEDEPKRPRHIDGSNGSAAPSMFTLVKPSSDDQDIGDVKPAKDKDDKPPKVKPAWVTESRKLEKSKMHETVNPSAVMDIINNNYDDVGKRSRKPGTSHSPLVNMPKPASRHSTPEEHDKMNGSVRRGSKPTSPEYNGYKENYNPNIPESMKRKGSGSSNSHHSNGKTSLDSSINSEKLLKSKHYRSSPNLPAIGVENSKSKQNMIFSRPCMACEVKQSPKGGIRPKSDYKMAFKAGKPNLNGSGSGSNASSRPHTAKQQVNIPKPKTPFAKRSYSINTLVPPFSLWQGTAGMEYPEHWRLASVYQHSYKPMESRKKPLLQSVYH